MRVPLRTEIIPVVAMVLASSAYATNLTEQQAIAVAKVAAAEHCSVDTPCTYKARREAGRWLVFVTFTKRNSPEDALLPYPGGHEIIVVDKTGKVVDTMPGE
jgi:hypothetical protein